MTFENHTPGRRRIGLVAAGAASAALGLTVLVGWHTHSVTLIQVHPAFAPMQYNTATGFLLSGLMLLALANMLARVAIVLASIVAAIGALTLVQYALSVDFGIDRLLMDHYITVRTSHPGRMAPNTALSFSLTGIAVLLSEGFVRRRSALLNGIFGSLVLGLGITALLGYAMALETAYGWGRFTRMAVHTSAGFIVLGTGLFAFAWQTERADRAGLPRWLPIPLAVSVLTVTFAMWQALNPDRNPAALQAAHDLVLLFGIALAAAIALAVNKAISERTSKNMLESEIAEREQTEKARRESETRFRTLFENAGVSIWNEDFSGVRRELERLRADGVTDLRQHLEANRDVAWAMLASIKVTEVNAATLTLFGAETEQAFIESIDSVFGPGAIDVFIDEVCAIWEGKEKIFQSEAIQMTLSGEELAVIISMPIPVTEEDFRSVPVSIVDITERKRAEEALRQSQRMEAVGQLTGGVAHDFNNLLAIMLGNAELLELKAGASEESHRHIKEIKAAVLRGASLTQRLLAFSRKQMLSPVPADVSTLIDGLHDMLQRSLGEAIDLKTEMAPDLWPVMIDLHQFENALINLAVNARDASPKGGALVIEAANVTLDETYAESHAEVTPGDYVRILVSDFGTGMRPEVLERVFEPFFTTKEVGKGSGLGLSMVYGFVKQSRGHITIYSEAGHGTTVKLYLPRSREAAPESDAGDGETPAFVPASERILVVEDNPDVRAVPVAILRAQGYQVAEAADGEQAIGLLKAGPPFDLLFTDIVLPGGMNGVEIAKQAKRLQSGIKVIYTTGYAEHALAHDGKLDPGTTLVTKPYRRVELLERVRAELAGGVD